MGGEYEREAIWASHLGAARGADGSAAGWRWGRGRVLGGNKVMGAGKFPAGPNLLSWLEKMSCGPKLEPGPSLDQFEAT